MKYSQSIEGIIEMLRAYTKLKQMGYLGLHDRYSLGWLCPPELNLAYVIVQ